MRLNFIPTQERLTIAEVSQILGRTTTTELGQTWRRPNSEGIVRNLTTLRRSCEQQPRSNVTFSDEASVGILWRPDLSVPLKLELFNLREIAKFDTVIP